MYLIEHGEKDPKTVNGGLTKDGIADVKSAITDLKKSQRPNNSHENYIADIITSDLKCCMETAEIAAEILNIGIEQKPFYDKVSSVVSEEKFRVNVITSSLLKNRQSNESQKDFYKRIKILLSNKTINDLDNPYFSSKKISVSSPLLLLDDGYWRKYLVVVTQDIINAMYHYYGSYDPTIVEYAEKELFGHGSATMYKVDQSYEKQYDSHELNEAKRIPKSIYISMGMIRTLKYGNYKEMR